MAGTGGRRPGAGRKPKRLNPVTQSPLSLAELTLAENLPALVDVALKLALDGDRAMVVYCIDRVMGRPSQPVNVALHVEELAAEYNVAPERVTSIIERIRARQTG